MLDAIYTETKKKIGNKLREKYSNVSVFLGVTIFALLYNDSFLFKDYLF